MKKLNLFEQEEEPVEVKEEKELEWTYADALAWGGPEWRSSMATHESEIVTNPNPNSRVVELCEGLWLKQCKRDDDTITTTLYREKKQ